MQSKSTIYHIIFLTPLGDTAVIYREKPFVVLNVFLPRENLKSLVKSIKDEGMFSRAGSHPKAVAITESIINYFKGKPLKPMWEYMDMGRLTKLERTVLMATTDIPYGKVRSYKEIAESIGHPGAARFVGNTVAKNPFPLLIPCHRVVRSDGTVGKFGGGTEMKKWLIAFESENLKKTY